mmetsp:Transcript_9975/g.25806  ORF Transcript_9975/g.25806 Transcript_9975/m.25806 type:complete len:295 (-) Transcript_9975:106-990(-)
MAASAQAQVVAAVVAGAVLALCARHCIAHRSAAGGPIGATSRLPSRFILFGDSITQQSFSVGGWGARLQDRYQRRADVINRGFGGYNTRWALKLLAGQQLRDGPGDHTALVTIFFGANDASLPQHNLRQHVPKHEYVDNLRRIVGHLRRHCPAAALLLITPPPVCHEQRLAFQRQRYPTAATGILERTHENAGAYARAVVELAEELHLPCVDLWQGMQSAAPGEGWHAYLSDGLHLSAEGNAKVAELILEKIENFYPMLALDPDPETGAFGNSVTKCEGLEPNMPWHNHFTGKS